MFTIQKIETESICKDHSLPFVYICITKYCQCQVKLCEKCSTEHETENQNSNLMRMQNFYTKIETQVDIANKQNQKLVSISNSTIGGSIQESKQKFEKFSLNQIKVLEETMKYLNQESAKVNKEISQTSNFLTAKMNNIQIQRNKLPSNFCNKVLENNMVQNLVTFYNQKGFANFRKKLDKTLHFRAIIKDFLSSAEKFGKKYEQFMISSSKTESNEWSMKSTIKDLLKNKKRSGKYEPQNVSDQIQKENGYTRANNLINQQLANPPLRAKRAKTIFEKY